jgi:hypothetical protein
MAHGDAGQHPLHALARAVRHGVTVNIELKRRDDAVAWRLVATPPASTALRGPNGLLAPDVFESLAGCHLHAVRV